MSHNPVRAANWHKRNGRPRRQLNPHAGTKHSDIVRRQGMGATVPLANRQQTNSGFMASVMEADGFSIRQELVRAGTSIGYGCNPNADRVFRVLDGMLFVFEQNAKTGERTQRALNKGAYFCAPRGVPHGYATSGTADCELLIIETPGYYKGWETVEEGVVSTNQPQVAIAPNAPDLMRPARRPRGESKAKEQAVRSQRRKVRRQPVRVRPGGAPRMPSATGAPSVGRNASTNSNSANVAGVNPMPMGAGAYKE